MTYHLLIMTSILEIQMILFMTRYMWISILHQSIITIITSCTLVMMVVMVSLMIS